MDGSAQAIAAFLVVVMFGASYRSATRQMRVGDPFRPPRLASGFDAQRWLVTPVFAWFLALAEAATGVCLVAGFWSPSWAGAGASILMFLYLGSLRSLDIMTAGFWFVLGLHAVMLGLAVWLARAVDWGIIEVFR